MTEPNETRYLSRPGAGFEIVVSGGRRMRFPPHTHVSTVTVVLVRRGVVLLEVDGAKTPLRTGDSRVIPPHSLHCLEASAPYEMISFCLDAGIAEDEATAFLAEMAEYGHLRKREARTIAKYLRERPTPTLRIGDAVSRLKDSLVATPEREMTLADMAAQTHIGAFHLVRKFKKRYGLTPRGFQNQNRLRKARREFMRGGSLTQAALRAGFYDQSHFIKYFKRLQGMTPGQYLRALGEI